MENFGDGSPFVVGNPNLEPEESSSWELGVDQPLFDQRVLISATYFNNRYRNLIAFVSGPGVSFENVGKAESSGVEAGIQALLPWQLRFDGSYTFLETKVLQDGGIGGTAFPVGQPLLRRPKNQGSAALTYLGGRWTAAVIANMVDSSLDRDFTQPGSPRVTVPGFIILGLAGSYTALENVWQMRSLRLQLKIDNLLDKDYEQVYGFSQPGFSVRGGVMVNF